MNEEELLKELEKLGYKWGYVYGHGTDEPAGDKGFVLADLEKTRVLIKPEDLFKEPIEYDKYFGW